MNSGMIEFSDIYIDGTIVSEVQELDAEITDDFLKYFYERMFYCMDEHIELLAEFVREYDKAREPIPVNNRATRRSKGKMQEKSKWKRSNMKRRFYE